MWGVRYSIVLIIILLSVKSLSAQDLTYKKPYFLNVSFGGSPDNFSLNTSYNKVLEKFSYQISVSANFEDRIFDGEMTTFNANAGYAKVEDWIFAFANFGPSLSYGEAHNQANENVYFYGGGINFNAQAYFMPLNELFPGLGLGAEFYYNYNIFQTRDVNYRHVYSLRMGVCLTNLHMN